LSLFVSKRYSMDDLSLDDVTDVSHCILYDVFCYNSSLVNFDGNYCYPSDSYIFSLDNDTYLSIIYADLFMSTKFESLINVYINMDTLSSTCLVNLSPLQLPASFNFVIDYSPIILQPCSLSCPDHIGDHLDIEPPDFFNSFDKELYAPTDTSFSDHDLLIFQSLNSFCIDPGTLEQSSGSKVIKVKKSSYKANKRKMTKRYKKHFVLKLEYYDLCPDLLVNECNGQSDLCPVFPSYSNGLFVPVIDKLLTEAYFRNVPNNCLEIFSYYNGIDYDLFHVLFSIVVSNCDRYISTTIDVH